MSFTFFILVVYHNLFSALGKVLLTRPDIYAVARLLNFRRRTSGDITP